MATPIRDTPTLRGKDAEKFLRQVSRNLKKDHTKEFESAKAVYDAFIHKQGVTVQFEFRLQDRVKLVEIDRPGIIDGMLVDSIGKTYRVAYWHDGSRHSTWVYANEIKLAPKSPPAEVDKK